MHNLLGIVSHWRLPDAVLGRWLCAPINLTDIAPIRMPYTFDTAVDEVFHSRLNFLPRFPNTHTDTAL